jgi:hypothetical protein
MATLGIEAEIAAFNRHAWNLAWVYGGVALGLWLLSYVILMSLIGIPLHQFGVHVPGWLLLLLVSCAMLLLAWEGLRHARRLFDLDDYRHSFYSFNPAGSDEQQHAANLMSSVVMTPSAIIAEELRISYLISQVLFSAPRLSAKAWASARNHVRLSASDLVQAQEFLDLLGKDGGPWVHVADHREAMGIMPALEQLGLTESRVEGSRMQVRMIPEIRRKHE